jgi:hypothetical protein
MLAKPHARAPFQGLSRTMIANKHAAACDKETRPAACKTTQHSDVAVDRTHARVT